MLILFFDMCKKYISSITSSVNTILWNAECGMLGFLVSTQPTNNKKGIIYGQGRFVGWVKQQRNPTITHSYQSQLKSK